MRVSPDKMDNGNFFGFCFVCPGKRTLCCFVVCIRHNIEETDRDKEFQLPFNPCQTTYLCH